MKRNAIARIIIYSILAVVLTIVLLAGILLNGFSINFGSSGGTTVDSETSIDVSGIKKLDIVWACGDVTIQVADTDQITFNETAPENCKYQMTYDVNGSTLELEYGSPKISIGFGNNSMPWKDLLITVPKDWVCEELQIEGADLTIGIQHLTAREIDMDGAANNLEFVGSVDTVDIDGASNNIHLNCDSHPTLIDIDGASCELELILPKGCGFAVEMNGLSCDFSSELDYSVKNGQYIYGNGHTNVNVDGISCDVTITESDECVHVWDGGQQVTIPGSGDEEMVYTCTLCGETKSEPVKNVNILDMQKVTIISGFMGLAGIRANGTVIVHNHNKNPVPETENWQDIRSLAAGNGHIVGLKADGTVIATGDNTYGQCNVSTWNDVIAIDCGGNFTVGLKTDGTVLHTGSAPFGVDEVKTWKDITMLEAAADRVIGLKKDGIVVALGDQNFDVCQVPEENDIIDIYLDHQRAIYLHSDGRVEIKGNRLYVEDQTIPGLLTVESDGIYLAGMKEDGSMYFDGYDMDIKTAGQIVAIVDLYLCKLGLRSDGTLVILTQYGGSELTPPSWSGMMIP